MSTRGWYRGRNKKTGRGFIRLPGGREIEFDLSAMVEPVYFGNPVLFDLVNNKITNVRSENGPPTYSADFGHPDRLAKTGLGA